MVWVFEWRRVEFRDGRVSRDGRGGTGGSGFFRYWESRVFGFRELFLCFRIKNSMVGVVIGRGGLKIKDI